MKTTPSLAFAVFLLALWPAMAQAQTAAAEPDELPLTQAEADAFYGKLRGAYEGAILCRGIEPEDEQRAAVAARLNEITQGLVMPGKQLSMIDAAKAEVARLHRQQGCDGPKMSEFLGVYDAHLADLF